MFTIYSLYLYLALLRYVLNTKYIYLLSNNLDFPIKLRSKSKTRQHFHHLFPLDNKIPHLTAAPPLPRPGGPLDRSCPRQPRVSPWPPRSPETGQPSPSSWRRSPRQPESRRQRCWMLSCILKCILLTHLSSLNVVSWRYFYNDDFSLHRSTNLWKKEWI